ncbi:MAG TPA: hypothetical protein ACFYD3_07350, partial [Candidatus Hypogeohydataceae bacterium YC41]
MTVKHSFVSTKLDGTDVTLVKPSDWNAVHVDADGSVLYAFQKGLDASKPVAGTIDRYYLATDTKKIYRDTGTAWEIVVSLNHSDLAGITATQHHSNVNDPTSAEKAALAGTSGSPSATNKVVTDADPRNTNARTPTAHKTTHTTGGTDALAPSDIGAEAIANKNTLNGYAGLDVSGKLAGSQIPYGNTAGTACQGNDARLSDARTPTAHKTTHASGGSDPVTPSDIGAEAIANKNAANGYAGLDASSKIALAQLSAHKSTHATGGSDALSPTDIGAEATANKNATSGYAGLDVSAKIAGSQIPYGNTAGTACQGNDARLSDARTPTTHASSHERGGSDIVNAS